MTGSSQSAFHLSGHPVGQLLAMLVMGVVLVGAVIMGAFVVVGLAALFAIGYAVFWVRAWWRWRRLRGGPPSGGPEPRPAKGIRYLEGEYEVVEADADAARRRSGTGL
jgi:hypothetical protein